MSNSTLRRLSQKTKNIAQQISGARRAIHTAEHAALHLANVERWAQNEFVFQRQAHELRLVELEKRVAKLEKVQNALSSAASPSLAPKSADALDVIAISEKYYQTWQSLLEEVCRNEDLLSVPLRVLEFDAGAAKNFAFLQNRVVSYLGVEPSEILRAAAEKRTSDPRFSFVDAKDLSKINYQADLVLLFAEKHRWSVYDLETLLGFAESRLSSEGEIVLHIPYSFSELSDAGWDIASRLSALGLQSATPTRLSSQGSYIRIGRAK